MPWWNWVNLNPYWLLHTAWQVAAVHGEALCLVIHTLHGAIDLNSGFFQIGTSKVLSSIPKLDPYWIDHVDASWPAYLMS